MNKKEGTEVTVVLASVNESDGATSQCRPKVITPSPHRRIYFFSIVTNSIVVEILPIYTGRCQTLRTTLTSRDVANFLV